MALQTVTTTTVAKHADLVHHLLLQASEDVADRFANIDVVRHVDVLTTQPPAHLRQLVTP